MNAANTGLARRRRGLRRHLRGGRPGPGSTPAPPSGGCPTGDARATPGFALPARFIVHAVGPVWHGGDRGEPELLASAYRRALEVAGEVGAASIAFPAISTGIFGYPLEPATAIAVAHRRATAVDGLELVRFVCFDAGDARRVRTGAQPGAARERLRCSRKSTST